MRAATGMLIATFLLGLSTAASEDVPDTTALLQLGLKQIDEGNFGDAVLTLDGLIQRLTPEAASQGRDLSRAHLYRGVALVGLSQEELAKASFRDAHLYDPELRLAKGQFPDRVRRIFDAARTGKKKSVLERPKTTAKKAGIGGATLLAVVGGVAAAVGGVAVAAGGNTKTNTPPTASVSVTPQGRAIVGVTEMSFSATGSDPDGDPLTYTWNFGDGATATGPSATHIFRSEGTFQVSLVANDGTATMTATTPVVVGSLSGGWTRPSGSQGGATYHVQQDGSRLYGNYVYVYTLPGGYPTRDEGPITGQVTTPRNVRFTVEWAAVVRPPGYPWQRGTQNYMLIADENLNTLSGTMNDASVVLSRAQ